MLLHSSTVRTLHSEVHFHFSLSHRFSHRFLSQYNMCPYDQYISEHAVLSIVSQLLKKRKEQADELIKDARLIDMLEIPQESDWEQCHTATSEPYFYDQS